MKFKYVKLILFLIFLFILSLDVISIYVDPEVSKSLIQNNTADVIVMLNDNSNLKILGSKLERISQLKQRARIYNDFQDDVLSEFNGAEFKLKFKFELVNGFSGQIDSLGLEKLKSNFVVRSVHINRNFKTELFESVPFINENKIPLEYTGAGQAVCIVDTGINYSHPDLGGCFGPGCKVVGGYDFFSGDIDPKDVVGHGTSVAGVVAATGGIEGIAPDAKIAALKVCGNFSADCSEDAIMKAFDWCTMNESIPNINVITLSLGVDGGEISYESCDDDPFAEVIHNATLAGIVTIKSSGNDGLSNAVSRPGCFDEIITVGAVYDGNVGFVKWPDAGCSDWPTWANKIGCGSNRARFADTIFAPGSIITTTNKSGGYRNVTGTSFAAPHVAGLVAGMFQKAEAKGYIITPSEVEDTLGNNGVSIWDVFGSWFKYPRINAAKTFRNMDYAKINKGYKDNSLWNNNVWYKRFRASKLKSLRVRLVPSDRRDDLDLRLVKPDGSPVPVTETGPGNEESKNIAPVSDGIWTIKVIGDIVPSSFGKHAPFDIIIDAISKAKVGGINFTDLNLDYVSTCELGRTRFVMKGEEDNGTIINSTTATNDSMNYFFTGLAIPSDKLWITLDVTQGAGGACCGLRGDVSRIDSNFRQTKMAQVMLDADVKMKFDQFGNSTNEFIRNQFQEWINLVQSSSYWSEIQSQNFNTFPSGQARTWISPSKIDAEGDNCTIRLTNLTLNVSFTWDQIALDLSSYSFNQYVINDLNSRLNIWKENYERAHNENITNTTLFLVNNHPKYKDLRRVANSLAIAQWYKQQDRDKVPFGSFIDSSNVSGFNITFNQSFWEDQAFQYIGPVQNVHSFIGQNFTLYKYGGVSLDLMIPNITGEISNHTKEVIDNTSYFGYERENNTIYFETIQNPKMPDLVPYATLFSTLTPDVNETLNITAYVKNEGEVDLTSTFDVKYSYHYTSPSGYNATYLIGTEQINGLDANETKQISILTELPRIGINNVIIEIDSGYVIDEYNELNNNRSFEVEVVDIFPIAFIRSPENGEQIQIGEELVLDGIGVDFKDGILNESLNWTSSLDGYLGSNASLLVNLSVGTHIIKLTVQDSDRNNNTDQIAIRIYLSQMPTASITSPPTGTDFEEGELAYFTGESFDFEDGILNETSLNWTSSIDGFLGYGEEINSFLSMGTHIINLTATDSSNIKNSSTISITIQESTPSINIILPTNNSEFYSQTNISFNGTSTDPHEGDLSSNINWSSNIDGDIGGGSFFGKVLSEGTHTISAFIIDRLGLTNFTQRFVTVLEPLYPSASIISPTNGQIITHGNVIDFRGGSNDPETGALSGASLVWSSNINGNIGTGLNFSRTNLSIGTHEINLTTTDPQGLKGRASINIQIISASPNVTIYSPIGGTGFALNDNILFNGSAFDLEDGVLSGSSLKWYRGSMQIGTGNTFSLSNLTLGTHIIKLNATDSHGKISSKSVGISILGFGVVNHTIFSDGTSYKNLVYNTSGQKIVYVTLPKAANITGATVEIEGLAYE